MEDERRDQTKGQGENNKEPNNTKTLKNEEAWTAVDYKVEWLTQWRKE